MTGNGCEGEEREGAEAEGSRAVIVKMGRGG